MSAPNIWRKEVREKFCFRAVTLKELYDAIDSLDSNKSPGSGICNDWAMEWRQASGFLEPIRSLFLTHA